MLVEDVLQRAPPLFPQPRAELLPRDAVSKRPAAGHSHGGCPRAHEHRCRAGHKPCRGEAEETEGKGKSPSRDPQLWPAPRWAHVCGQRITSCLPPGILWWSVWLHLVENSSFFTI